MGRWGAVSYLYCVKYLPLGPSVASEGLACCGVFVVLRYGPRDSRYRSWGMEKPKYKRLGLSWILPPFILVR